MIPSPKLDDREFDDIVAEAMRLIPRYCPEWTHHNPSDPGITLIELAAWMTDLILYRLNRVPEKNYIAFLNLLGIKLKAPQAARALLKFSVVDSAKKQIVPAGTQVTTPQAVDEETITFETARDLIVTPMKLDRVLSYYSERYTDHSARFDPDNEEPILEETFEVFGGAERVERYIYLNDQRFASIGDQSVLRVYLGCPERGGRDLARLLEWEYWNGDRWRELDRAPLEVDRGEVCFFGPLLFETTTVYDIEGLWMRGRLAEVANPEDTEVDTVEVRVEVSGEGIAPLRAVTNLDDALIYLDQGKTMYPFSKEPKLDSLLYLDCPDVMRSPGAEIAIEFLFADPGIIEPANPSDNLTLSWEYFDGKKWQVLGRTGPRGVRPGAAEFGFHDDTNAFTENGTVSFRRPPDMRPVEISGEESMWIRIRLEVGDYGLAGQYTLDNDRWVFKDERPLRPPALRSINFRYREDYGALHTVVTFNDFRFEEVTDVATTEYTLFQPFDPHRDESPALYLGFAEKLPNDAQNLYFVMAEDQGPASVPEGGAEVHTSELTEYHASRLADWELEQRVVWEYWDGEEWEPLSVTDSSHGFTTSGFVEFVGPDDWQQSIKFTEERHWLRARLEMGGYTVAPRIREIFGNCVDAYNQSTIRDEILGSSDGTPMQIFNLLQGPLLEGEIVQVRELQRPSPPELADLGGADAVKPIDEDGETDECWVKWKRVDSFFESKDRDRHYMIDYQTGQIVFGDGRRGLIPPQGLNSIMAEEYRVGGGADGNVNAHTLTSLARALAYIDSVDNPISASGGASRESVAEAKERAPYAIKARDRAVTAEDFEMLALRASTSLARARCVPDRTQRGAVTLVLLPKAETNVEDLPKRLVPSNEMLRYVQRYLDERRLVGTLLDVIKPRYVDLSLKVTLLRRSIGSSDRLRREIEGKLRRFMHPIIGGRDEKGWEFGRSVLKTDLIHLVEEVPGVEGVHDIDMLDEVRRVHVEHVRIEDDELPFLVHIHIIERVREEIM